jgi:hypothetical protein
MSGCLGRKENKSVRNAGIPEPDMDILKRLYDFGGMLVYQVSYFDPMLFQVIKGTPTFSEDMAKAELGRLQRDGFAAGITSFMVKFDGAFSKKPTQ